MLPILYSFRRCPYAMRARMAIGVSGREVEHREILLRDRPVELRAISEEATVPCLEIAAGHVLAESLMIMDWALSESDPFVWRRGADQAEDAAALIDTNDGEFKHHLDRFKYSTRYEGVNALDERSNAEKFIIELDRRLRHHDQLLGDTVSVADVAIFPFVRQFSRADEAWFASTPYAAVRRWLSEWESRDVFRRIMAKIPVWQSGDPVRTFSEAFPRL